MRIQLRWQLVLAGVAFGLILTLLSYQQSAVNLCTIQVPAAGGVLIEGMVGAPTYLNPVLGTVNPIDQELTQLLFDGLVQYDEQGQPTPALAERWTISEDGRHYTFTLRPGIQWHDETALTATDVRFTYQMLQQSAPFIPPPVTTFWQQVQIEQLNDEQVAFHLPAPFPQFLDLLTRGIIPAHQLSGVQLTELPARIISGDIIGSGPFLVPAGESWQDDGRLSLTPNPGYWRQGVRLEAIAFQFYPSEQAAVDALARGDIQAINNVLPEMIPLVAAVPDLRLFTTPRSRMTQLLFNLSESGHQALRPRDVRRGLAYALDREQLIAAALNGQAVPLDGPYLPDSWAYDPTAVTPFTYDPEQASTLLDEGGWLFPEDGAAFRQKDDQSLTLRLLYADSSQNRLLAAAIAAQWEAAGIVTQLQPADPELLRIQLAARAFDVALVDIEPLSDPDLYDFWSQIAIINGQNYGGWNNRTASELLEEARQMTNQDERALQYARFVRLYDQDLPAVTLFQHLYTYALGSGVEQLGTEDALPEIGHIYAPRVRFAALTDWFMQYEDVVVLCEE